MAVKARKSVYFSALLVLCIIYWKTFLLLCLLAPLCFFGCLYLAINEEPNLNGKQVDEPTSTKTTVTVDGAQRAEDDKDENCLLFPDFEDISAEINVLIENIINNFILSWFRSISDSDEFPCAVRKLLRTSILRLGSLLENIDLAELMILKILPLLTKHYEVFCLAHETIISDQLLDKPKENVDLSIAVEFNKQYRIHKGLSLTLNEESLSHDIQSYSRKKATELSLKLIDAKEMRSPYVSVLIREILASSLLQPIIGKVSSPDFWNTKLTYICSKVLKDRSQVTELRAILSKEIEDQHSNKKNTDNSTKGISSVESFTIDSSEKDYELFLKQISTITNSDQLNLLKLTLLVNVLKLENSRISLKKVSAFRKRIELAFNMIHSKLNYLNVVSNSDEKDNLVSQISKLKELIQSISINDILENSSCLEYFSSFLAENPEQSGFIDLQLWKYIELIRNPLEDVTNEEIQVDSSEHGLDHLIHIREEFFHGFSLAHLRELDSTSVSTIIELFQNGHINPDKYINARRSMLLLQKAAFKSISDKWFPLFKSSDSFYDMVSTSGLLKSGRFQYYAVDQNQNSAANCNLSETVKVVTYGDLGKALDDILSHDDPTSNTKSQNYRKSFSTLFGEEEKTIFNDDLFDNSSIQDPDQDDSLNLESIDASPFAQSNYSGLDGKEKPDSNSVNDNILSYTNLKEEIGNLALSIDGLKKELDLLHHLILKAELTNNQSRLLLLKKSERSLTRELEYKELLKQQYMVHENANSLYGRAKVSIKSYLTNVSTEDGREVVYYLITVQHLFNKQIVSWDIPRRFSEFYRLNSYLKEKYPSKLKYLQYSNGFPERVKMSLKYHVSKTLLYEERRKKLESYMRELLSIREVCQDEYFRKYLTDVSNTFKIEHSVTKNGDDDDKRRSVILSRAENNVEVTSIEPETAGLGGLEDELNFFDDERNFYSNVSHNNTGTLVKPICELFISFFALNQSNSGWLRGRAIIVVLQRLLGSTIEKYIKDLILRIRSPQKILILVAKLNNMIWVDGVFFKSSSIPQPPSRTEGEISRTCQESQAILESFMIEVCGKVVGTLNARNAGYRLHSMLQNGYLNVSLILEILDVLINEIFRVQSKSSSP